MALYELILLQSQNGKSIVNRFHYHRSGSIGSIIPSLGLIFAFGYTQTAGNQGIGESSLWQQIQALQATAVQYQALLARNLYDPTDFYELPITATLTGASGASEAMSPAICYKFRTNRVRTDIDRGKKAIAGVSEGNVLANGTLPTTGSMQNALEAVADMLGQNLSYVDEGVTLTFSPVILGSERVEPVPPATNVVYRRYATEALQEDHMAVGCSWEWYPHVRTQRSRQY
jgi:hypothetical protein